MITDEHYVNTDESYAITLESYAITGECYAPSHECYQTNTEDQYYALSKPQILKSVLKFSCFLPPSLSPVTWGCERENADG